MTQPSVIGHQRFQFRPKLLEDERLTAHPADEQGPFPLPIVFQLARRVAAQEVRQIMDVVRLSRAQVCIFRPARRPCLDDARLKDSQDDVCDVVGARFQIGLMLRYKFWKGVLDKPLKVSHAGPRV